MKFSEPFERHREEIRRIVEENHARNPRAFNTLLYREGNDQNDLDLLVDSTPDTSLWDLAKIAVQLQDLLGIELEVLTPKSLNSLPERFRLRVLGEAIPV